ncbi:PD-(D/E)XK nuclease family protein [Candidatus Micrarchaeota archaeon]|nr:PD-(D/E)XK nuclease family protein [Candidatus Micrarchaeota archaeon]
MTTLYLHNKEIESVFELLGTKENDITFSLGWSLKQINPFLKKFIREVSNSEMDVGKFDILLQEYGVDRGYTDIELLSEELFCIIEAKRGWNLPTKEQLNKYISRFNEYPGMGHKLIVISDCKKLYAKDELDRYGLTLSIEFISWRQIRRWLNEVRKNCNNRQKLILEEMDKYFEEVIVMQDKDSNEVFCVVISEKKLVGNFTFLDVVKKGHYFYPIRGKWPKLPPTYIAFRNRGKLMSIHHVNGYEIVNSPDRHLPEIKGWRDWSKCPHYMLELGKPFKPEHEVKNGNIYASQHIKCRLDTLFTCRTIQEARNLTLQEKKA